MYQPGELIWSTELDHIALACRCLSSPCSEGCTYHPFDSIGRGIIDFSNEAHGKASLLKVIGNVFIVNMIETVAEGLVLAEKSKLGKDNLHKFIEAIFPGPFTLYSHRMITGDYYTRDEVGHHP